MIEFQNILEQIKSVENQVFYIGLTDDEVKNLEFKINKQFPTYYREFLKTFGFQQDLVKGLFTNVDEFLEHNGYLEEYGEHYVRLSAQKELLVVIFVTLRVVLVF